MNILVFDFGNTRIKFSVWGQEAPVYHEAVNSTDSDVISKIIDRYNVNQAIFSSLKTDDQRHLFSQIKKRLDGRAEVMPRCFSGYKIPPTYQGSLGVDRFAGYLAAKELCKGKNCLIVDAGSALTTDVIDAGGYFRGGNISPGLTMRLKALNQFTHGLPEVPLQGPIMAFGVNTDSAIRSGVVNGIIAEIAEATRKAAEIFSVTDIILTGGDMEYLRPQLEKEELAKAHFDPLLVERGINIFARINHSRPLSDDERLKITKS